MLTGWRSRKQANRFLSKARRPGGGRWGFELFLGGYFLAEEALELTVQDQQHAQRGDVLAADLEEGVAAHFVADGGFALVLDHLRADLPADHQGHQQAAKRHEHALGDHVEEVQPAVAPALVAVQLQKLPWRDPVGAQTVNADQHAQQRNEDAQPIADAKRAADASLRARFFRAVIHAQVQRGFRDQKNIL